MASRKLRIHRTEAENLISNLRGEVGELITTWMLLRHFISEANALRTDDPSIDLRNQSLSFFSILVDRLRDDLTARLSELAEEKIGRLNFYFAAEKLGVLQNQSRSFSKSVIKDRIREKRNQDVSHKELPETMAEMNSIYIDYKVLLRALARAVQLMKKFDLVFLGPEAPYLWAEVRKQRYKSLLVPSSVGYILLPYMRLPTEVLMKIHRESATNN